ncbi:MAG: hypothetical protein JO199_04890 [Candidatus Eremiobacteraeota bacterium]|nr:hypothetical protein [Candidatus Eremiobacteraeota bacterium]
MMLLRMREAGFEGDGVQLGPLTLDLPGGEYATSVFADPRHAAIAARLAAGIVKATYGSVSIDAFDPRVQPAHCKRIAAFVPHDPLPPGEFDFERYVAYRAALWDVDPIRAIAHAKLLLERLDGVHEAFAYPLAGALVSNPKLLVLDRPAAAYAPQILAAAGPRAIFSTHCGERDAAAFLPQISYGALLV